MKFLKVAGLILLVIAGILLIVFLFFKSSRSPIYEGELKLPAINEDVEVYYTEYGVPHIYANNDRDAYYAFGYVHAQDRLWQMDLLRHVGSGTLSELFGKDLIGTDKFLRTMGIASYSRESAEAYIKRNHESLPLVEAYLEGINQFIATNPKTLEHTVLGIEIEPFTLTNVFEVLTYMAFSFQKAHITDPILTELSNKLDSTYLNDLNIYHYPGETTIEVYDDRYSELTQSVSDQLSKLNVPQFIGSNSWVLSSSKTKSGKVILANDPHIGFAQPSVWYEAHLTMPGSEYYGYHLAGFPFPPILHTPDFANGLTMFQNDDADFYVEEIHPEDSNLYRHEGEWKTISSTQETVKVKDSASVDFQIRSTIHGPIVSDILGDEPLEDIVSMYWVTTKNDNFLLETTYGFTRSQNIEEVEKFAGMIHGPGLNVMYGDKDGNVAWWASGKLINRRNEQASKTFFDGSSGLDDVKSFIDFKYNPHSINPPAGYTYSANNQPDTVNGMIYSGYYLPDDRGERITELLDKANDFDVEKVKTMMLDHRSNLFYHVKDIMLESLTDSNELIESLKSWNADFSTNDFRPVVFQKWMYEVVSTAMQDEMGEKLWKNYKESYNFKVAIEHLILNDTSKWWDNVNTNEIENRTDIINRAFSKAISDLKTFWGEDHTQWKWGDAHQLTHNHAMGTALSFLNVGPFAVEGGNEVINNMGYSYNGGQYQHPTFGPSTRRVVDFSDVRNNSWSILPSGNSGNFFSPFYDDQAAMYAKGEFRKMMMNEEEIMKTGSLLKLLAN